MLGDDGLRFGSFYPGNNTVEGKRAMRFHDCGHIVGGSCSARIALTPIFARPSHPSTLQEYHVEGPFNEGGERHHLCLLRCSESGV